MWKCVLEGTDHHHVLVQILYYIYSTECEKFDEDEVMCLVVCQRLASCWRHVSSDSTHMRAPHMRAPHMRAPHMRAPHMLLSKLVEAMLLITVACHTKVSAVHFRVHAKRCLEFSHRFWTQFWWQKVLVSSSC